MYLNSMGDSLIASNGTLQDMGDCLCSSSVVNGNGDLATLTYQVLSNAPVNITLTGSELDTLDADSNIQVIPSTVSSLQIAANISGFFSAVQQGTSNSAWSIGPNPNPVNSTLAVDIQVNNASNIWGWSIPNITWNRNLLQLLNVTEGSFLVNNTGANPTVMCGNLPSQFDNVNGTITGGLSEQSTAQGAQLTRQAWWRHYGLTLRVAEQHTLTSRAQHSTRAAATTQGQPQTQTAPPSQLTCLHPIFSATASKAEISPSGRQPLGL